MNNSREELVSTVKPAGETPGGNEMSNLRKAIEKRPASLDQNTILDTQRNMTAINTQRIGCAALHGSDGYAALEIDFRGHHETNAARRRGPYEHYRLVYRYGYDLGVDQRYRDAEWADVEPQARPRWEERNPGTWALFQDTIRYAWATTRGSASDHSVA
jgi:hypothetical protein